MFRLLFLVLVLMSWAGAGSLKALPEPKDEEVLDYEAQPDRLTRDLLSRPYQPASLAGKKAGELLDWMMGKDVDEFWRDERRKQLPAAVDLAVGTPEEVVVRLIERDRAGRPGDRPEVVLPASVELPASGFVRLEMLISACRAPERDEVILRWHPTGAWIVATNSRDLHGVGSLGLVESMDLGEARRLATICLLLAQSRFGAVPVSDQPAEPKRRYIFMSSHWVTMTLRSDDGSVAEQVGHQPRSEELDQAWPNGWTPEFAAFLCRRIFLRTCRQLHERRETERAPVRSREEKLRRSRDDLVAQARAILEWSEAAPEVTMPFQLERTVTAILECDLRELHPQVEALARRLPAQFPWEKRVDGLKTEIAALTAELAKHSFAGLAEAIERGPLDPVDEPSAPRFPPFIAEKLQELRKRRAELKEAEPFYALLPYQIERDWADLRRAVAAVQRRVRSGDAPEALTLWARENARGSAWAYRRLQEVAPGAAAIVVEARLQDPAWNSHRQDVTRLLRELRSLAPARVKPALERLSPEWKDALSDEFQDSDLRTPKTLAERLANPFRRQPVGKGCILVLEPLTANEFSLALQQDGASQLDVEERAKRALTLAPHVGSQPEPLQARYLRFLGQLPRRDRAEAILVADLRSQRAFLLEHATSSHDDYAPRRSETEHEPLNLRLHEPRWTLGLWDERDAVTRAALAVALDLFRSFQREEPALRWRLQENFRATAATLSSEDRGLVALRIREFAELVDDGLRPADFEANWLAALEAASAMP